MNNSKPKYKTGDTLKEFNAPKAKIIKVIDNGYESIYGRYKYIIEIPLGYKDYKKQIAAWEKSIYKTLEANRYEE